VIAIHTTPFKQELTVQNDIYTYLYYLINQFARFAVHFFFALSGYFYGLKVRVKNQALATAHIMAKKVVIIFLAWSYIYLLPYNISSIYELGILGPIKMTYWNIVDLANNPSLILLQGTKIHLWFLIGLLCALYLVAFFVDKKKIMLLLVITIILYIFGVLAKSYSASSLGINIDFDTRNGPFFSSLLFTTGYILSGLSPSTRWAKRGFLIFVVGLILHFLESYILWEFYGTKADHDYVIGTYFMGTGVTVLALSNHKLLRNKRLSNLGQITLGIYASHFVFVDLLLPLDSYFSNSLWELGYIFLVLMLSITFTFALAKSSYLRKIVC
jgi:surface polysaccharide O-acyltransferase-like enzyme